MPPSSKSVPSPSAPPLDSDEFSSDSFDDKPPSKTPVPSTSTSKSPNVLKSSPSKSGGSSSKKTKEALVKSSKKTKADASKGAYAPVPLATAPPSFSDSEFSSDPENQYPSSSRRTQPRAGGQTQFHDEEVPNATDEEQEEEKEGRPAQTPQEKRKRMIWIFGAGGAAIVLIIAILVTIMLLHSGKSDSNETPSHSLNSTETNSTLAHDSSSAHNSTSHNSTLSHGSNSSMSLGDSSKVATALPTNGTAIHEIEETESVDLGGKMSAASSSGSEDINTAVHTGSIATDSTQADPTGTMDLAPLQTISFEGSLQSNESVAASTTYSVSSSYLPGGSDYSLDPTYLESDLDSISTPTAAPSSSSGPLASDDHQSTDGGMMTNPLHSDQNEAYQPSSSREGLSNVPEQSFALSRSFEPVTTATPTISSFGAIPTDYLRPAPLPQASDHGNSISHPDQAHDEPTHLGSAWWPAPTLAPGPSVPEHSEKNKSTKWVGKATWFDPNDAPKSCQLKYKETDFVVAISTEIYGDSQSVSTFCGAKVHVWNEFTNQTRNGTILAVCEDCEGPTDINLSQSMFSELDNPDIGVLDVQWWFDDPLAEEQTTIDLSAYESTAQQPKKYETTAIFFKETGWKSSCGKVVEDDSLYVGLPLELWSDPTTPSNEYCGKTIKVKNVETGATIEAEVVEASNRTDYTTFTKHAFEKLGGNAETGELAVEFSFD
ncbi:uncharacterized protein JCM6883_003935 [Sporobolomyces salmoneus]|uniref:uncharacterized protein n=1 Tax=Sporobolomyces salmoneus TaxID=183962 RepID=UPI00316FDAE9